MVIGHPGQFGAIAQYHVEKVATKGEQEHATTPDLGVLGKIVLVQVIK